MESLQNNQPNLEVRPEVDHLVGIRLREIRTRQGLSLRQLAALSGLNINTLSLVENGRSSPSVSTLQQIAIALDVPIIAFFESARVEKNIVFTQADTRHAETIGSASMEALGQDFVCDDVQSFVVTLRAGQGSGDRKIIHTGSEMVFCLQGSLQYQIGEERYTLNQGDSLLFKASLPHVWQNLGNEDAKFLLTIFAANRKEKSSEHHFTLENLLKEKIMKIAIITEDGKTISQHFGRAPFYKVFSIEEGNIIHTEMREKMGHHQFASDGQHEHHHGADHGHDAASHGKHTQMANAIADCQTVICGGMGMGAYESMRRLNIQPIVTDLSDIEEAVKAYLDGSLVDHTEKLH